VNEVPGAPPGHHVSRRKGCAMAELPSVRSAVKKGAQKNHKLAEEDGLNRQKKKDAQQTPA